MKKQKKTDLRTSKKIIVFYDNDHDGFGAAWVAWRVFGSKALYILGKRDVTSSQLCAFGATNAIVYFLDFCPNNKALQFAQRVAHRVIVIDHHETVADIVKSLSGSVYSLKHSACVLTWKYFYKSKRVPRILRHIEDVDLWKWKMPGTRELLASLSWRFDFRHWDVLARIIENPGARKQHVKTGKAMLVYEEEILERMSEEADRVLLGGCLAFAVNGPRHFNSLLGSYLLHLDKHIHVGIVFYFVERCKYIRFSLRSDGRVDVGRLAEKFGGGGRHDTAAFQTDARKPLPFKFIKKNG